MKRMWIVGLIFILTFGVYLVNLPTDFSKDTKNRLTRRMLPSHDAIPNTFLPYLIIKERALKFDPILQTIKNLSNDDLYYLIPTEEGYYSAYPIIPGLLALPIYWIPILLKKIPELTYHENILKILLLGRITAAFYAAIAVSIFYLILKKLAPKQKYWQLVFTIFFALGTNMWSVASRGMWQHPFAALFNALITLILIYSLKKPKLIPLLGLLLGISVLARPTNIVLAIILAIYIFIHQRKYLTGFVLAILPCILFLAIYNHTTFGSALTEGYGARKDYNWSTPLTTSIPGYFISPARGFLFISPPLLFGFWGIYKAFKNKDWGGKSNAAYRYLGLGLIGSMIFLGKWYTWDGAPAFGCRMLSDYLPIFGVFSFEVIRKLKKKSSIAVIGALIIYSIYVHGNAVFFRKSRCGQDHNWSIYCLLPPKEKAQY